MRHEDALRKLQQDPTLSISLVTTDATGNWTVWHHVFLDDCGELRIAHPTEKTGDVPAPLDGDYRLDPLEDPSEHEPDDVDS